MARLDSSIYPALSESVVAKLDSQSIFTVYDFMLQKCDELMKKTGMTFKEIEDIRRFFFTKFGGETANPIDLYERDVNRKITTGILNLDALLEGGLRCGAIYEICGSSPAGKSQLCHWLSVHATLNDSVNVHYIDGSRNFCASRIQMMLDSRHCSDSMIGHVMSSIKVYQICKIHELFSVFHSLSNMDKNQNESLKRLIVVDSLSVLCSVVSKKEFNSHLSNFASVCRYIVNHFDAVILIVNTVRSEQHGTVFPTGNEGDNQFVLSVRPSLGNYWLNVPNVRLLMTQEENSKRKIAVWKSNQLEQGKSCFVHITDEGVIQR